MPALRTENSDPKNWLNRETAEADDEVASVYEVYIAIKQWKALPIPWSGAPAQR